MQLTELKMKALKLLEGNIRYEPIRLESKEVPFESIEVVDVEEDL